MRKKLQRMRLVVGQQKKFGGATTKKEANKTLLEPEVPPELPSVEEALKLLAWAMDQLSKPGLTKVEIARFKTLVSAVKTYQTLLADYINYRAIEEKLVDLEAKYARWVREETETARKMRVETRALRRVWPIVTVTRKSTVGR